MEQCVMVSIAKLAVLMEDFSDIETLIEASAEDPQKLLDARNTWEVFFAEYDDDPREIPEIPEVKNWIHASLEAGIPWFYFIALRSVCAPSSPPMPASGMRRSTIRSTGRSCSSFWRKT